MTLSSLRNRVRRLELRRAEVARPSIAERMRSARQRWDALTPQEQAAERCQRLAEAVAALRTPEPDDDSLAARLERSRRRCGRRHLAAMASLDEPDLTEPSPFDVAAYGAWSDQQHNRTAARRYLADVALAGDLLKETP